MALHLNSVRRIASIGAHKLLEQPTCIHNAGSIIRSKSSLTYYKETDEVNRKNLPFALRVGRQGRQSKRGAVELQGLDTDAKRQQFFQQEIEKYNKGKRWLAQMMGEDPETFTKKDAEAAIAYLLPSSLYAKDARPKMGHPEDIYADLLTVTSKVDSVTKRPFDAGFYTGHSAYYNATYEVWQALDLIQNTSYATVDRDEFAKQQEKEIKWKSKMQIEKDIKQRLSDSQFSTLVKRVKRMASDPRSGIAQHVIDKYTLMEKTEDRRREGIARVPDTELSDGEARAQGKRKTSIAEVYLKEGSGIVKVNHKHLNEYFKELGALQQVAYPLLLTKNLFTFDIEAYVMGGGPTGQAGALRLAISRALAALRPELYETLESAVILQVDKRKKERKKPGRARAKKKFAWRRR